jgi:FkbM family methyltransferase
MSLTNALSPLLRWKHRIATSPLAGPVGALRGAVGRLRAVLHPELGLLHAEHGMTVACLRRMVRADWNCVDIGAHVGSVSYLLSRLAPRGHLTVIEALPAKAAALRARFPRATVHQLAVGDRAGEVTFFGNTAQPGFSSLSKRASRGETRELRVPKARIDDLWPVNEPLHLIKIDVEGHEYPALRGAKATFRRHRPAILFEAGAADDPDTATADYDGLFAFLTGLGYAIRPVFHQFYGREPASLEAFTACRRYPLTTFNFFATQG